jgi:hypothetical protein
VPSCPYFAYKLVSVFLYVPESTAFALVFKKRKHTTKNIQKIDLSTGFSKISCVCYIFISLYLYRGACNPYWQRVTKFEM